MSIAWIIETALNQRLLFGGPYDSYWFIGLAIVLAAITSIIFFIWLDQRKKARIIN